jgi:hypothetical protein
MYHASAAALLRQDARLPTIPGGVATVAVLGLVLGLWLCVSPSSNPASAPLRLMGVLVIAASIVVLAEVLGVLYLPQTPW